MQLRNLAAPSLRNRFNDNLITFTSFQSSIAATNTHFPCLLIKFRRGSLPWFAFILNTREKLAEQLPSVASPFLLLLLLAISLQGWQDDATSRSLLVNHETLKKLGLHRKPAIRLDFPTTLDSNALKTERCFMTTWSLNYTSLRYPCKVSSWEFSVIAFQEIGFLFTVYVPARAAIEIKNGKFDLCRVFLIFCS